MEPKSTSFSRDRSPNSRSKLSKIAKYLSVKDKKLLRVDEIERTDIRFNDVAKSGIVFSFSCSYLLEDVMSCSEFNAMVFFGGF